MPSSDQEPGSNKPLLEFCRSLAGATEDIKWDNDLVFSVGGKMFAVFQWHAEFPLSCKVDPAAFEMLVQQEGIRPAPYLARASWVQIEAPDALEPEKIQELLQESHRLVAGKLTKKLQRTLGLIP